ncbi:MAG: hypothetical protein IKR43_06105 [Lachnospiraceae bacterium]|nr:hypothetical protein [Lachnospiraceae bacterium]
MKAKKIITLLSLAVILFASVTGLVYAWKKLPPTYDGTKTDVQALYDDPAKADPAGADGAAAVIVQKNLGEAYAANDVASIVFDFRGYDTLGESFILLTAIAGSFVILSRIKDSKGKEEEDHEV